MESTSADAVSAWLARLQAGEPGARARWIDRAFERLDRPTRPRLRDLSGVGRREQAGDVRQAAPIRRSRTPQQRPQVPDLSDATHKTARSAARTEFHERVETLPDEKREVFDLLWYRGLTRAEAAAVLGITERTAP